MRRPGTAPWPMCAVRPYPFSTPLTHEEGERNAPEGPTDELAEFDREKALQLWQIMSRHFQAAAAQRETASSHASFQRPLRTMAALAESVNGVTKAAFTVGQRVKDGVDFRGTVRYVGTVVTSKKDPDAIWVGVERVPRVAYAIELKRHNIRETRF